MYAGAGVRDERYVARSYGVRLGTKVGFFYALVMPRA